MSRDQPSLPFGAADAPADAAARRLAQTELSRPVVVEAGAGTGKTALLVARMVAWLLGRGWEDAALELGEAEEGQVAVRVVEGVVAITFTEAAAAEMAQRLAEYLADLERGRRPRPVDAEALPPGEEATARAGAVLRELHRLRIGTIHSFCQSLLAENPLDAHVAPHLQIDADGLLTGEIVHRVVEESLEAEFTAGATGSWLALVRDGIDPSEVVSTLANLRGEGLTGESVRRSVDGAGRRVAALERDLAEALTDWCGRFHSRLAGLTRSPRAVDAAHGLDELRRNLDARNETSPGLWHAAGGLADSCIDRLADWACGRLGKLEAETIGGPEDLFAATCGRLLRLLREARELDVEAVHRAAGLVAPLLDEVVARSRQAGVTTFGDLLAGARDLLASSPAVLARMRRSIRQLLVDEFQDTDRVQCELVRLLTLGGEPGERPGLFIVGDPKQSIYGWRSADLEVYDRFKDEVRAAGGAIVQLSVSFRAPQAILDQVGAIVGPSMVEERGMQPPYASLLAGPNQDESRAFRAGGRAPVELWASWRLGADGTPEKLGVAERVELEAAAVARDVAELHSEAGVAWDEVGILLRAGSYLDTYLDALRRRAIPFEVHQEREYYRQREVVEAAALLRWLINPGDQLALLTLLRSDPVGVPDAALAPLWAQGLPDLLAQLPESDPVPLAAALDRAAAQVPADIVAAEGLERWPTSLRAAVDTLRDLRAALDLEAPHRFVERVRSVWLAEATATGRFLGGHRVARLERFFGEVEDVLLEGSGDLATLERLLRRKIAEAWVSRRPVGPPPARDAVRVMTIHAAKGLDFDHVYLVDTDRQGRRPETASGTSVLPGPHLRLFRWPTPGYPEACERAQRVETAERVRLLYVALTRARRRLVVAGDWRETGRDGADARTFMDLLSVRCDLAELRAQALAGDARRPEDGGVVQWVIPTLLRARDDRLADAPTRWQEMPAIAADARFQAAARMARPFVSSASAEAHDRLEESLAATRPTDPASRDARAVGTEVHRLLEELDLERSLDEQVRAGSVEAAARLADQGSDAVAWLERLLQRTVEGELLARLASLGPHVLARELPVLLPPEDGVGPVGAVSGTVDLVYRDPDDGALVVADYKTDLVDDDLLAARAEIYRPQLGAYVRALREGVDHDGPVRSELWFLWPDRVLRL